MNNIFRELIKNPFERDYKSSKYEWDDYLKSSIHIANILKDFNKKDTDAVFELVRFIFKGRLNITKNLKITKFHSFDGGYLVYDGKYKDKQPVKKADGSWENERGWHDIRVEIEFMDYKIVANIIFMETGEIRQWQWRFDGES